MSWLVIRVREVDVGRKHVEVVQFLSKRNGFERNRCWCRRLSDDYVESFTSLRDARAAAALYGGEATELARLTDRALDDPLTRAIVF